METAEEYRVIRYKVEGEYFVQDKFISSHKTKKEAVIALSKLDTNIHGVERYICSRDEYNIPIARQDFTFML